MPFVGLAFLSVFAQLDIVLDIFIACVFLAVYFWFWRTDESYLVFGVLFVFLPRLFLFPGGPSLISVFLLLACVRAVHRGEHLRPSRLLTGPIFLFVIFGFVVIFPAGASITSIASYQLSVLFLLIMLHKLSRPRLLRRFLITISFSSVAGCIYGLINPNRFVRVASTSGIVEDSATRFTGVLTDPNYMAATLLIGAVGSLLIVNNILRAISATVLVYFILSTQSVTAAISLVLAICVVIILPTRRRSSSSVLAWLIAGSIILALWRPLQAAFVNAQLFSALSDRLTMQTDWVIGGSESEIASGRLRPPEVVPG